MKTIKTLRQASKKLTKAQLINQLKMKNIKGGNSCPPPIEDY